MSKDQKPVVLTCAQPTGQLTLGNYIGAVLNWEKMLQDYECYFGIVDMHAITVDYKPAELRKNTLSCVAQYIACGLDPEKSHQFIQSHVTGHAELAWILSCICPIGELQRMTQFKEKAAKLGFQIDKESENNLKLELTGAPSQASINAGLLYYPILMAADILLYNADRVPVGEDQKQHLELCRDLANRFNNKYSDTFTIPEPFIGTTGARIMSLADPTKKMSKSDVNRNGTLFLLDEPSILKKKIMSAVTDSGSDIIASDDKPGIQNLLTILGSLTGKSNQELEDKFSGKGYGEFKKSVSESVIEKLEPIQKRYHELMTDKIYLESVLKSGAEAAQKRAFKILSKVSRKSGYYERIR
jgi:tryptophanyl-tRNA synthetase